MDKWYNLSWSRIVDLLQSDSKRGLSFKQLEINIKTGGRNNLKLRGDSNKSNLKLLIEEMPFFIIFLLILLLILGSYIEASIICIVMVISIYSFYYNKKKRLSQFEAINNLNYTDVWVMRAGIRDFIKAEELVIGDIVLLKKGNIVPADIRIIESEDLRINERNILGEEFVSLKNPARIDGEINSIREVYNMAFRGSRVVSGEGKGIVVAIGAKTNLGSIVKYFNLFSNKKKHDENKISDFKKKINIYGILIISVVFLGLKIFNIDDYKIIVSNIVFIIATFNFLEFFKFIVMKYKIKSFENDGINNLSKESLKNFDDINVIFVDKLAAITEERMEVKAFYTNMEINHSGKINTGDINNERLMSIAVLCNNSKYSKKDESYNGDLKEGAILKFASENGVFKSPLEGKNKRIFEVVNDGYKNIKTTVNRVNRNYRANTRGTLDEILSRSSHIMIDGIEKPLDKEIIENIKKIDFNFQNTGYVTEGFAYRSFNYEPSEDENIENNLVFVGIVAYENPKKANAEDVIFEVKNRGIVPILFTDDNKITAYRIGKDIGLINNMSEVISGVEMLSLDKNEIIDILAKVKVFCRVNPHIRNKIIEIFVENKYKVCSTGENLSHMPSVLLSTVSVAKGNNAAALIKTLSTVSIEDDILKNIIYLYDKSKKHKYNLYKSLDILKISLLIEILLVIIINSLFKFSVRSYVVIWNIIIIPVIFSILILKYDKLEIKISKISEFMCNKWKKLK